MKADVIPSPKYRIVIALFFLSGAMALIYEIVWIRLFAINFGNTARAMSTVLSVYLGGIAAGAAGARKLARRSAMECLRFYGIAEIFTSLYAFLIPFLLRGAAPLLESVYGDGHGAAGAITLVRAVVGSAILFPATVAMGATLPFLARWIAGPQTIEHAGRSVNILYSVNLAGASIGAIASGFALLPAFGYSSTLAFACCGNAFAGIAAVWMARGAAEEPEEALQPEPRSAPESRRPAKTPAKPNAKRDKKYEAKHDHGRPPVELLLPGSVLIPVAFLSGLTCLLYEVAWGRLYGLLFGPTASTLTLILAAFLVGLTAGGIWAGRLKGNLVAWLCGAEAACALALMWAIAGAGSSPPWIADWVRLHNANPAEIEWMKVALLSFTLLPLTIPFGLIFPLTMRVGTPATSSAASATAPDGAASFASRIGGLYGINTAGCIVGSLAAGWLLIPAIGTERTLLLGGLLNLGLGVLLLDRLRPAWRKPALSAAFVMVVAAGLLFPRWDMAAMTAGGYKYAPYYTASSSLDSGQLVSLREGISGTVAIRRDGGALILSIDGKVDASDAGGDLLTEKLLAHLPLLLAPDADRVCLIGLASGVTAGAALTHSIRQLDVVEVSRDVVQASHQFDKVNRRPLEDPRTALLVADGRNHLALTSTRYDVIISEPSNPWIAGMNSLFTRDFFRIARAHLRNGGIFAQWFHIYNMPQDDLRSLFAAFSEVFPSAAVWKLNDGDILLTGFAGDPAVWNRSFPSVPPAALADLAAAGIRDPKYLLDLYVMRDGDLHDFARGAQPNTDDHPWLEFHGQRDLHAQTDPGNEAALFSSTRTPAPPLVRDFRAQANAADYVAIGHMFERAESSRSAFESYQQAQRQTPSVEAVAGMDRCARLPEERAVVTQALGLADDSGGLEQRIAQALAKARSGQLAAGRFLFEETSLAFPQEPAAQFNYGLFFLEQKDYQPALRQFQRAIQLDSRYLPAYEATAEAYLQMQQYEQAAQWSRRILEIDPNHAVARRTLAALEQRINHPAGHAVLSNSVPAGH